ncbi:MAG: tetratricopeptide repeat protein [Candidatus Heimdallarchaeota archaeon]|nr:tetratricopeptide repeat protein [Candidatus Heimdallarchaeota archaeon]
MFTDFYFSECTFLQTKNLKKSVKNIEKKLLKEESKEDKTSFFEFGFELLETQLFLGNFKEAEKIVSKLDPIIENQEIRNQLLIQFLKMILNHEQGEKEEAKKLAKQIITFVKEIAETDLTKYDRMKIAIAYSYLKKFKESINYGDKLNEELSSESPDLVNVFANYNLGVIYFNKGDYKQAKEIFERNIEVLRNLKKDLEQVLPLKLLALTHLKLKDEDKAEGYFQKITTIITQEYSFLIEIIKAESLLYQGDIKISKGKTLSAEDYLRQSQKIFERLAYQIGIAKIHQSLVSFNSVKGNPVAANRSLDMLSRLSKFLDEGIDISSLFTVVGIRAAESHDYTKAKKILEEHLPALLETKNEENIIEVKSKLSHAYLHSKEIEKFKEFQEEAIKYYEGKKETNKIEEIRIENLRLLLVQKNIQLAEQELFLLEQFYGQREENYNKIRDFIITNYETLIKISEDEYNIDNKIVLKSRLLKNQQLIENDDVFMQIFYGILQEVQDSPSIDYIEKLTKQITEDFNGLKDKQYVGLICNFCGSRFTLLKEYKKANDYLDTAAKIFEELDQKFNLLSVLHNFATVKRILEDYQKSVDLYTKEIELLSEVQEIDNKDAGFALAYQSRAESYYLLDKLDEARKDYESSKNYFKKAMNYRYYSISLLKLGEIYNKQENYLEARMNLREAIDITSQNKIVDVLINSLYQMGLVDLATKDLSLAKDSFLRARSICEQVNARNFIPTINAELAKIRAFSQEIQNNPLVENIVTPMDKGKEFQRLGNEAYFNEKYEDAKELYNNAVTIFTDFESKLNLANSLAGLAATNFKLDAKGEGQKLFNNAFSLGVKPDAHPITAELLIIVGRSSLQFRDLVSRGREYISFALEMYKELNDKKGEGIAYTELGLVYEALGQNHIARDHYIKALKILSKKEFPLQRASTLRTYSRIELEDNDYRSAEKLLLEALEIDEALGVEELTIYTYGMLGRLYVSMRKYQEAIPLLLKVVPLQDKEHDKFNILLIYQFLMSCYLETKQMKELVEVQEKKLAIAEKLHEERKKLGGALDGLFNIPEFQNLGMSGAHEQFIKLPADFFALGGWYEEVGDKAKAIEAYTKSLKYHEIEKNVDTTFKRQLEQKISSLEKS